MAIINFADAATMRTLWMAALICALIALLKNTGTSRLTKSAGI